MHEISPLVKNMEIDEQHRPYELRLYRRRLRGHYREGAIMSDSARCQWVLRCRWTKPIDSQRSRCFVRRSVGDNDDWWYWALQTRCCSCHDG